MEWSYFSLIRISCFLFAFLSDFQAKCKYGVKHAVRLLWWRELNSIPYFPCALSLLYIWVMGTWEVLKWVSFDGEMPGAKSWKTNKKNLLALILLTWSSYPGEDSGSWGVEGEGGRGRRRKRPFHVREKQIESHRGVCLKAVCKSTSFVITRTNPTFEVFPSCYKGNVFCLIHSSP